MGSGYAGPVARPLYNAYDNAGIGKPPVTVNLMTTTELQYILGDHNTNGQIDVGESAATGLPYLLWSAGADGIYGRKPASLGMSPQPGDKTDDVTNFDIPGDVRK
jgi:hypothetical protein